MTSSFAAPGDACVRGEWLAAASSLGVLEGRVHGGHPSGSGVISPFFTDSSMPLLSSEEASSSLLGDIEKKYLNPNSRLLPDDKQRLTKYLDAAKLMLMHQRQLPPTPGTASSDIHDRPKNLLDMAMASLAMEFCHLRIRRHDVLRDHRLGISPASIWGSVRRSCRDGSNSNSNSNSNSDSVASWSSSSASFTGGGGGSGTSGSSSGFLSALFEDMSVRSDKAFRRMDRLIDTKVLPTLNDIAGVMAVFACLILADLF